MSGFDSNGWERYCPDDRVSHCTLAMTAKDDETFYKAVKLILCEFEKIEGVFCETGLVKCPFPVEEIYIVELN